MSCVVGIVYNRRVYMAGDSAATNDSFQIVTSPEPKVYNLGEIAIGVTGSPYTSQVLHYLFEPPSIPLNMELRRYMAAVFIPALREFLKDHAQKEDNLLADSNLMVGVRDRLFVIYSDFQVEETRSGYNAIGAADNVALGSIYATRYLEHNPSERLQTALEAAQEHNASVLAPFVFVTTQEVSDANT